MATKLPLTFVSGWCDLHGEPIKFV